MKEVVGTAAPFCVKLKDRSDELTYSEHKEPGGKWKIERSGIEQIS